MSFILEKNDNHYYFSASSLIEKSISEGELSSKYVLINPIIFPFIVPNKTIGERSASTIYHLTPNKERCYEVQKKYRFGFFDKTFFLEEELVFRPIHLGVNCLWQIGKVFDFNSKIQFQSMLPCSLKNHFNSLLKNNFQMYKLFLKYQFLLNQFKKIDGVKGYTAYDQKGSLYSFSINEGKFRAYILSLTGKISKYKDKNCFDDALPPSLKETFLKQTLSQLSGIKKSYKVKTQFADHFRKQETGLYKAVDKKGSIYIFSYKEGIFEGKIDNKRYSNLSVFQKQLPEFLGKQFIALLNPLGKT